MVISDVNQITYNGNGVQTAWPFTFEFIDATDIKLQLIDADGARHDIISDYYVDKVNKTVYYPGYAPGSEPPEEDQPPKVQTGQKLRVYRKLPVNQLADLGDKWPFQVIEKGLDKLTMLIQDVWGWIGSNILQLSDTEFTWDAKGYRIKNVGGPVSVQDAATKDYVDKVLSGIIASGDGRIVPFDTVAQMVANDLVAGKIAVTLGYDDINDCGSSVYAIRAKVPGDVNNDHDIVELDNGNIAEKIDIVGNEINPDAFPGNSDAEKLQAAIDYAITLKTSTVLIARKFDITGSTLYIDKYLYNQDDHLRQKLTFLGTGSGEIYKGDSGYIFSGTVTHPPVNFSAGDISLINMKFRGADSVITAADRENLCSVFDCHKIIRITTVSCSYTSVGVVFDGSECVSATTNAQSIRSYGDLITYSHAYVTMQYIWDCIFTGAVVEACNYGAVAVGDDAYLSINEVHFIECCIEGSTYGGIVAKQGNIDSGCVGFQVIGCYFEANGPADIVVNIRYAYGTVINNNHFAPTANCCDLWVYNRDWMLNGNTCMTNPGSGNYLFYVSQKAANIAINVEGNHYGDLTNDTLTIVATPYFFYNYLEATSTSQHNADTTVLLRAVYDGTGGNITNAPTGETTGTLINLPSYNTSDSLQFFIGTKLWVRRRRGGLGWSAWTVLIA